jgi:regulator of protease activity HflC (stomatin/prohibitin superfamily)
MNVLQVLLDWLRQFWPMEIVYSYQKGVRFWLGRDVALLEPGLHWYVPFFGHIEQVTVVPDIIRLGNQNLTTRDGKTLLVAANIRYEVTDARAAFCNVQEFATTLSDAARVFLASSIREYELAELLSKQSDLERDCKNAINRTSRAWGIRVVNVGLADFVVTRSFSLANV